MSTVILIESDHVFAAVVDDYLQVAGHKVLLSESSKQAVEIATERTFDLVIMAHEAPSLAGIRALRAAPATRNVPIISLPDRDVRNHRIAALRAGADDVLAKPVDLDELQIRVDQHVGSHGKTTPALSGDLTSHPLSELLQYVHHMGRSGRLVVTSEKDSGEAQIIRGDLGTARWRGLSNHHALLAMLSMERGRFRFEASNDEDDAPTGSTVPLHKLLFDAAWVADELSKRRQFIPATGAKLEVTSDVEPVVPDDLGDLAVARVLQRLRSRPGLRIYDLITDHAEAPNITRLTVAWLREQGFVTLQDQESSNVMTTGEISTSMVFELTVATLLGNARKAGFETKALPFLLVAIPEAWPTIKAVLQSSPGYLQQDGLRQLVGELDTDRSSSVSFASELGKLSLHVQLLNEPRQAPLETIVAVCGGVMIWLQDGDIPRGLNGIVRSLAASRSAARGMIIAATPAAREAAQALVGDDPRWRISSHAPRSLIGILRLYQS